MQNSSTATERFFKQGTALFAHRRVDAVKLPKSPSSSGIPIDRLSDSNYINRRLES